MHQLPREDYENLLAFRTSLRRFLIDRAETAGLVERWGDADDGRITHVRLTAKGETRLAQLAAAHLDELQDLAPVLDKLVARWTSPADGEPDR